MDVLELNHFYDEHGKLVFDQWLFWDWNPVDRRYDVRAWLLNKGKQRRVATTLSWDDNGHLRRVRAIEFRETWTQYDPELVAREVRPKEYRRGLTPPRPRPDQFRPPEVVPPIP